VEVSILTDLVIIFGLSLGALFVFHYLRVPAIVGFLFTGVLVGPHGLQLIAAVREVEVLAEIGVVLLLFTIGIEFSLQELMHIRRAVLLGGTLQVLGTVGVVFTLAQVLGQPLGRSLFLGFLVSLSSTAIVLKLLAERAALDSPQGRTALGILIFQDLSVVPMMLLVPFLAGAGAQGSEPVLVIVGKASGVLLLVFVSARYLVPTVLYQVVRTRSRELFLVTILLLGLGTAWVTAQAGLSLALGAFLAGLVISESEYSQQALSELLPFRDIFFSFFLVSIGMLFDVSFLLQRPVLTGLVVVGMLAAKSLLCTLVTLILGYPLRVALLTGLALAQVGEFSFILSRVGLPYGLLPGDIYQLFLAAAVLTMAATPFLLAIAPSVADTALRLPLPRALRLGRYREQVAHGRPLTDHVIIVGFGLNGRNLARVLSTTGLPYLAIEMNPDIVRAERARGIPIHYGDACAERVLRHAGIRQARVMVIAISDPAASRRVVELARRLHPEVHIIVRTRYLQEVQPLSRLGATEVIPEEFETSIEIFARVLQGYLVPREVIERHIADIRQDAYEMLRQWPGELPSGQDLKGYLSGLEIRSCQVSTGSSVAGKTLAQLALRPVFGVTVLAIRRGRQTMDNPSGQSALCAGDVVIAMGKLEKLAEFSKLCRGLQRKKS
jgi:CPA2 family monovalent cation:H+ antiporter-2